MFVKLALLPVALPVYAVIYLAGFIVSIARKAWIDGRSMRGFVDAE